MFQSKIVKLHFLGAALLATGATHCLNPVRVMADSLLMPARQFAISNSLLVSENLTYLTVAWSDRQINIIYSGRTSKSKTNLLLADNIYLLSNRAHNEDSRSRLLRLLAVSFFLFLVPCGIFYPLFLFYKKLLIKPEEPDNLGSNFVTSSRLDNAALGLETKIETIRATVSKLQIAFTPPASDLRKELSRVSSEAELNTKYDLVDLMHQTIAVLLDQQHWTHVSYDSDTLPLKKVEPKFELISNRERKKFINQQSRLIKYNRNVTSAEGYERNYSYVVVTLIFCTSHASPLFDVINTKERLAKELVKLSKIERNTVIRFELLWNPQQEDVYISNEQLLIEYGEMSRLF